MSATVKVVQGCLLRNRPDVEWNPDGVAEFVNCTPSDTLQDSVSRTGYTVVLNTEHVKSRPFGNVAFHVH